MPPEPAPEWISAHLFLRGSLFGAEGDRVVRECVEPFVRSARERGWVDEAFFIRYGELGPHLRLRLRGRPAVLGGDVAPALEAHAGEAVDPALRGAPSGPLPPGARAGTVPWLAWIPSAPEVERYGGPRGVAVAEGLFARSTELAFALLGRLDPADRQARVGLALPAMLALLGAMTRDAALAREVAELHRNTFAGVPGVSVAADWHTPYERSFARQGEAVVQRVRAFWAAAADGAALPAPLDAYHAAAVQARGELRALLESGRLATEKGRLESWDQAVLALVSSYLHMANNRLGLSTLEEGFVAHLLLRGLEGL